MANLEFCDTHNMVADMQKPEGSEEFYQIVNFLNISHIRYALTENPTIYVSLIQQFWQTATTRTLNNGEMEITAIIDGKVKIVTEASVRRHLKLEDSDAISILPTTNIFKQLALMGNRTFNFSKMIFNGMVKNLDSKHKFLMYPRFIQGERSTVPVESHRTPTSAPSTSSPHLSSPPRSSIRQETKAEAKRKKPMTQAQQRTYMSSYIKHMGSYTLKLLKNLSFDEIKELFEATMRSIKDFVPMENEDDKLVSKLAEARSSKRDAEEELDQGRSKKQKIGECSEPRNKDVDELSQEELQQLMIIVPEQGMNVEALQNKYPIIDWEIYIKDTRKY
uniref:Xylulose kinase-1 n=1 Tax=Tanacetum cinerariifolium TaxID=118510 RepID=A0A6L2LUD8_TANCI|nr:hypothetical protein [Tanacetum cinerariifolium]